MSPEQEATTSGGHANAIHSVNSRNTNEGNKGSNKFERSKDNWNAPMEEMIEVKFSQLNDAMSSSKRKRGSWLELKLFFGMICGEGSRSVMLMLFGTLCAVLSGCCLSVTLIFTGRMKHVLLTHTVTAELFRIHAYEQVYVLSSLTVFAVVTNFCFHMASLSFGSSLVDYLSEKYAHLAQNISSNRRLQIEIQSELNNKIEDIRFGVENFQSLCRSCAIITASTIVSFYHEFRLTVAMVAVTPVCIAIHFFSQRLNQLLNDIKRGKAARSAHMEKELLLLNNTQASTDEHLLRLSDQLSSAVRYGIMKEAWSGFYSGVITFVIFTAVGCGMLYGGYLLEMDIIRKHGNIFIAVLSMTLVANTAGAIISQWSAFDDGLFASMFIMNVNDSELDKKRSEPFKTDRTARNANENSVLSSSKAASIVENSSTAQSDCSDQHRNVRFFMSGTNKVLKNNRHDRLLLALGIFLAILHGLELPAYNILMGRVFAAMREPRHDMIHRLFVTMVMFTCVGFIILVVKTVSGFFAGIVTEHVSVGFRINLVRHHSRYGSLYDTADVGMLVHEHATDANIAKSFYHPYLSQVISHVTSIIANIIIGFVFSWEVALLGTGFTLICLIIQLRIISSMSESNRSKFHHEKSRIPLESDETINVAKENALMAVNFSLIQTCGFIIQTICYALTAYIVNNGYKHPNEAFMSVIAMYGTIQHTILLPPIFKLLIKSCSSAHHILKKIYLRPSTSRRVMH